jgi:hypothetical protein
LFSCGDFGNSRFVISVRASPRGLGDLPKSSNQHDRLYMEYKGLNGALGSVSKPEVSERSLMTHIVRETPRNRLNQCDNTLLDSAPKLSFWPLAIAAAVFAVLLAFAMMR